MQLTGGLRDLSEGQRKFAPALVVLLYLALAAVGLAPGFNLSEERGARGALLLGVGYYLTGIGLKAAFRKTTALAPLVAALERRPTRAERHILQCLSTGH